MCTTDPWKAQKFSFMFTADEEALVLLCSSRFALDVEKLAERVPGAASDRSLE